MRLAPAIFLLLWAGGYTVAKIGIGDADPLTLLSTRFALALAVLLPVWLVLRPALPKTLTQWRDIAIVGFLMQTVYFGSAWSALEHGASAGTVALITCLHPIIVALAMPLISSERVSVSRWLGLLLGLGGAALVLYGNLGMQPVTLIGVALSFLALFAFSGATLWEKTHGVAHHPVSSNLVQYSVGLLTALPFAYLLEPMQIAFTPALMWALAYLVLCNSLVAISLLLWLIRRGEATRVSALFFLVPPMSAVIAWLVLNEVMTLLAWLGMALAAAGVWLATRRV